MTAAIITLSVAVLAFVLQEGITNIIHGIIFNFSKIHLGDRIEVVIDGVSYTGCLTKRTIRHIIINEIETNAEIVIPNTKIDTCVIKNSYNGLDQQNKYFLEFPVSYNDAENKKTSILIKNTIWNTIKNCKFTVDAEDPTIFINYRDSYVAYTFLVVTKTVEDNFKACSEIRESLMQTLSKQNIHIPFNVLDVNCQIQDYTQQNF